MTALDLDGGTGARRKGSTMRRAVVIFCSLLVGLAAFDRPLARATIMTSGNFSGGGTPYNGTDNPWATNTLRVGDTSPGSLSVTGGYVVNNTSSGIIASASGSTTSSVVVDGAGSQWNNSSSVFVGNNGTATLDILGGGSVSSSGGAIGFGSGSQGTVTVGNGIGSSSWTSSAGGIQVGSVGPAMLNINTGGTVTATALDGGNATSSVNFDGGTLSITATDSASNIINLNSGGGTIDTPTAGRTFTVTSGMSGAGGLTKTGQGTLALTAANGYNGNTIVSDGTLKLSGSGSFANSLTISLASSTTLNVSGVTGGANFSGGRFSLASGQTLKGTGTATGPINIASGATIAPGNSVGTLATADISIASGGTLALEIDFAGGGSADLLDVTGAFAVNSSTLDLSLLNGFGASVPQTFLVVRNDSNDAISGTFTSITGLSAGQSVSLDYVFSGMDSLGRTGDGNDLAVIVTAVPEARACLLLAAVAAATIGGKLLRKKAQL